jgi:hypothetical protein
MPAAFAFSTASFAGIVAGRARTKADLFAFLAAVFFEAIVFSNRGSQPSIGSQGGPYDRLSSSRKRLGRFNGETSRRNCLRQHLRSLVLESDSARRLLFENFLTDTIAISTRNAFGRPQRGVARYVRGTADGTASRSSVVESSSSEFRSPNAGTEETSTAAFNRAAACSRA